MKSILLLLAFAVLNAEAAPPLLASCEKEVTNSDGSVKIVGPKVARGDKKHYISYRNSNPAGICKLFGYEKYLDITREQSGDLPEHTINITESGGDGGFTGYGPRDPNNKIDSVTCYNGPLPKLVFKLKETIEGDDNSSTIILPTIERGANSFYLSDGSDLTGICRAYGYDAFLDFTLKSSGDNQRTLLVSASATFAGYKDYGPRDANRRIDELSCYKSAKPQAVVYSANKSQRNADGSTSFYLPQAKHGRFTYSVSGRRSSPAGLCLALGLTAYLETSLRTSGDLGVTEFVGEKGTHAGFEKYGPRERNTRVDHIACYDSQNPPKLVPSATKTQNPDGSVTVSGPKAKRGDGEFPLSARSDLTGVCRLFGYTSLLEKTLHHSGDLDVTLLVNGAAAHGGFKRYGPRERNEKIDSLVCY